jgi:hypothetical protein
VLLDNALFIKYKKYFVVEAMSRHLTLHQYFSRWDGLKDESLAYAKQKIQEYFRQLLGAHYVYCS